MTQSLGQAMITLNWSNYNTFDPFQAKSYPVEVLFSRAPSPKKRRAMFAGLRWKNGRHT
jgi:hypothetical protein